MDIILSIVFYFPLTYCMLALGYSECYPVLYLQRPTLPPALCPILPLLCAQVCKISAPSVRDITTVHKFTSPWEPSDICVGGVVGNSKGIARVFVTRGREGKGGLQWKCETWDIGG